MSLLPLLHELLDDQRRTPLSDLYDQHFGGGLWNNEILQPSSTFLINPLRCGYLRPWRNIALGDSGISTIKSDKNGLQINLDVQQFKPEELKVSVADGYIVINGNHEERSDEHGFVSRQFTRRYKIPDNVDEAALASSLSSDGVLTLKAPPKALPESKLRDIPIIHTNKPAIKKAQHKAEEKMEQ